MSDSILCVSFCQFRQRRSPLSSTDISSSQRNQKSTHPNFKNTLYLYAEKVRDAPQK